MGESQQLEKRIKDMAMIEFAIRYRAGRPADPDGVSFTAAGLDDPPVSRLLRM